MSLEINYYFQHPEKLPVAGVLDGLILAADILPRATVRLKDLLVTPDICENHGDIKGGAVNFHGNYYIGEGTVIYGGVTIMGPAYIGKNCEIMPGAVIRPNTIIGDNCSVGHGCEIKHCVLFGGAKAASLAFVGDSVLGASARIGSGVITANRKFNQSEVTVRAGDARYATGQSFFGVVMGDSSRIGANSVTQPGTHIGPHTWVFPMTTVRGFIPREKRVYHPREIAMEDNEIIELAP